MPELTMTIGGDAAITSGHFGVINPASGEVCAEAPECSRAELDLAMDAAAKAYVDWRGDERRRRELLGQVSDLLFASVEELAPILTSEQGKSLGDAKLEVFAAAIWFRYFADLELPARSSRTTTRPSPR